MSFLKQDLIEELAKEGKTPLDYLEEKEKEELEESKQHATAEINTFSNPPAAGIVSLQLASMITNVLTYKLATSEELDKLFILAKKVALTSIKLGDSASGRYEAEQVSKGQQVN